MPIGVLLQTIKNKTYTPKNTCSGVSKDRSQRVSSLVLCYVNREQGFWGGGGVEYKAKNFNKNNKGTI